MLADRLHRIEAWVFDLDNTLYPPEARLLEQVNARMTACIMRLLGVARAEADRIREAYWLRHGITLRGLVEEHGVDPDRFLAETHAIDLSAIGPDPALAEAVAALPGRRVIHTNGARGHAEGVLAATGLAGLFDAVLAIEDKGLVAKPDPRAYAIMLERTGLDPATAVMIEDTAQNLEEPRRLGMGTVWLDHGGGRSEPPGHVDLRITALAPFLRRAAGAAAPRAGAP
jgi:putative hydrolase of the HAD superfamily